jgi:hypothetical protein
VFLVAMAVVFPEALPFPLLGPFDGPRNRSRHMPITREMLEELLPMVLPLSGWMTVFKKGLHPYGGELQFAKDQDWRDGPTIYKYKLSGQSLYPLLIIFSLQTYDVLRLRRNRGNERLFEGRRLVVSKFSFRRIVHMRRCVIFISITATIPCLRDGTAGITQTIGQRKFFGYKLDQFCAYSHNVF